MKNKNCRTLKTSHRLEEFGGKLYLENICIYIYAHITSIFYFDSPKMDLFHPGSYYSPAVGGDSWGIIAFFKKTWGNVKKQPGSNFSTNWEVESQNFLQDLVHLLEGDDEHPSSENEKTPATRPL